MSHGENSFCCGPQYEHKFQIIQDAGNGVFTLKYIPPTELNPSEAEQVTSYIMNDVLFSDLATRLKQEFDKGVDVARPIGDYNNKFNELDIECHQASMAQVSESIEQIVKKIIDKMPPLPELVEVSSTSYGGAVTTVNRIKSPTTTQKPKLSEPLEKLFNRSSDDKGFSHN